MELQTFNSVYGFDVPRFKDLSEQAFDLREIIVEPKKQGGIEGDYFRILQHLNSFPGGLSGKQTFYPDHNLIFKGKALCDICFAFKIIDPCKALANEIDRSAGMADGLQVFVFGHQMNRANGLNGLPRCRRQVMLVVLEVLKQAFHPRKNLM